MLRPVLAGFVAGFLAVLVFHQGTAWLLHAFGNDISAVARLFGRTGAPFSMVPTRPLGVPRVLSLAFWGGVWGIPLALLLARMRLPALLTGLVFGALLPTAAAVLVVPALKGLPLWNGAIPWRGLLLNGAWGFGTALMLLWPLRLRA